MRRRTVACAGYGPGAARTTIVQGATGATGAAGENATGLRTVIVYLSEFSDTYEFDWASARNVSISPETFLASPGTTVTFTFPPGAFGSNLADPEQIQVTYLADRNDEFHVQPISAVVAADGSATVVMPTQLGRSLGEFVPHYQGRLMQARMHNGRPCEHSRVAAMLTNETGRSRCAPARWVVCRG